MGSEADRQAEPSAGASTLVDGHWSDRIPADDRGLTYADGIFRTLTVAADKPIAWRAQYWQLAVDCSALGLQVPAEEDLRADLVKLFADSTGGVARITVTRSGGGRGYAPPADAGIRRIVTASPWPGHAADNQPLDLSISDIALGIQPALAGIKHLGRLEQVIARAACQRAGVADLAMCDAEGWLVCTTMRNLLFVDADGGVTTPALTRAGVAGATRARLLAELGDSVAETDIRPGDLDGFVGAIATNSVTGVRPVTRIGVKHFSQSQAFAERATVMLARSADA
ncbi:aminodeoxychorismate lyase [Salinisphaera sp. USBA-960]|nr:aminodeoxychorismate lyase [Salifodinibacter halophilus]